MMFNQMKKRFVERACRRAAAGVGTVVAALGVAVAGLAMTATAQAKEWTKVRVALTGAYEPWNFTLPNGKLDGFEPELLADLCARIKIECEMGTQDFNGMIPALQIGKFDVLMDSLSITPERQKAIAFSRPYATTPVAFVSADPNVLPKAPEGEPTVYLTGEAEHDKPVIDMLRERLKGKTIGMQSGVSYHSFVDQHLSDVVKVRDYKTAAEHTLDLVAGRIDVAFDAVTYWSSALGRPQNKGLGYAGQIIRGPIWGPGEALGFRKSDDDLRRKFDEAIEAALADGTLSRLSEKWFKVDITPRAE
ncbi:MAG: transporter substrate-binding domain-containing protein [Candidimonas sp.]